MNKVKFSIGMATYDDFDGVYFTTQNLFLQDKFRSESLIEEIIVVDNNPGGPFSEALVKYCRKHHRKGKERCRYVPLASPVGTAPPRNEVFSQAVSDYVVCVDSHILLAPGALESLADVYVAKPKSPDLYQGPMFYDSLDGCETHFADEWRGQMWGTWAYDPREKEGKPFEIPAMGLGLFACRKNAWLWFHPGFRGFGGEEWYIHEKFRQHGRKTWCVPQLKWCHRFGRPAGTQYKLTVSDKVRNYALGLYELGIPLDRCRHHFTEELVPGKGRISKLMFDSLTDI